MGAVTVLVRHVICFPGGEVSRGDHVSGVGVTCIVSRIEDGNRDAGSGGLIPGRLGVDQGEVVKLVVVAVVLVAGAEVVVVIGVVRLEVRLPYQILLDIRDPCGPAEGVQFA